MLSTLSFSMKLWVIMKISDIYIILENSQASLILDLYLYRVNTAAFANAPGRPLATYQLYYGSGRVPVNKIDEMTSQQARDDELMLA